MNKINIEFKKSNRSGDRTKLCFKQEKEKFSEDQTTTIKGFLKDFKFKYKDLLTKDSQVQKDEIIIKVKENYKLNEEEEKDFFRLLYNISSKLECDEELFREDPKRDNRHNLHGLVKSMRDHDSYANASRILKYRNKFKQYDYDMQQQTALEETVPSCAEDELTIDKPDENTDYSEYDSTVESDDNTESKKSYNYSKDTVNREHNVLTFCKLYRGKK